MVCVYSEQSVAKVNLKEISAQQHFNLFPTNLSPVIN